MVYISKGNIRMDIPTFSLLSKTTCKNSTTLCRKNCYANKAERYSCVLVSRMRNTFHSFRGDFVNEVIKNLSQRDDKYIRLHEAGDFYSQEYLEKWFSICRQLPNKKFLCYTQVYDLDWKDKPDNLIRYWSIWPDSKGIPKKGLKAYVFDNGKGRIPNIKLSKNIHICKKGMNDLKCNDCLYCFNGKGDVGFKIH